MGCTHSSIYCKKSEDNHTIGNLSELMFAMETMGFEFSDSNRLRDMFNSMLTVGYTSASSAIPVNKVCAYFGHRSLMKILSIVHSPSVDFQHFVFVLWNFATIGDHMGMCILIYIIETI